MVVGTVYTTFLHYFSIVMNTPPRHNKKRLSCMIAQVTGTALRHLQTEHGTTYASVGKYLPAAFLDTRVVLRTNNGIFLPLQPPIRVTAQEYRQAGRSADNWACYPICGTLVPRN